MIMKFSTFTMRLVNAALLGVLTIPLSVLAQAPASELVMDTSGPVVFDDSKTFVPPEQLPLVESTTNERADAQQDKIVDRRRDPRWAEFHVYGGI